MGGAFIILAVTVAVGLLLWAWEKARGGKPLHHHAPSARKVTDNADRADNRRPSTDNPDFCCGMHAVCEKTGQINETPVYYDDEELDRFAGRDAEEYTDEEIEEFRDVLLTLMPSDAPGWVVSLERRQINLPSPLRPELDLLLSEI